MATNQLKLPRPGARNPYAVPAIKPTMDDTDGAVKLPEGYHEPLAKLVAARYEKARRHRSQERLEGVSLHEVLMRCWRQVEGEIDPCLMSLVEETGVDLVINQTLLKVEAGEAWMRTVVSDAKDMPFTVEPTPIAQLPKSANDAILRQVKGRLFLDPNPVGDLLEMVRGIKAQIRIETQKQAKDAARNMERLMADQCEEGDFRLAMQGALRDFFTYPFCVLEGPVLMVRPTLEWQGDRLVERFTLRQEARRRSPFDFFPSPDSPDTQRGGYVILRDRMTLAQLFEAAKKKSYIGKNILQAIKTFSRASTRHDWLNRNPEHPDTLWRDDEEIDVLTMYGKVSGRELSPYGLQVDDGQSYEATVKTLGGYVIAARINRVPDTLLRPIHTASMSKNGDRIAGKGLAQKMRDIDRAYHATLRNLIRNNSFSAGPIGEVDFTRIQRYVPDDQIGMINPYEMHPVDADVAGGGRPAFYFHAVPNIAAAALQVMQYFERMADRVTQIPAAFHGEAIGTGVNRTFRGTSMLQGNAMKGLQVSATNFGNGVLNPYAQNLFNQNMRFHKDDAVKGDSKAKVRDLAGLLQREIEKQEAMERLTLVAQVAQAGELPAGSMSWAARKALEAAGVDMDEAAAEEQQRGGPQAPLPGTPAGIQSQGALTPQPMGQPVPGGQPMPQPV